MGKPDSKNLDLQIKNITQQILDEDNSERIKDLTQQFNVNQSRKNVLRVLKMNGLLDSISDEMVERFEKHAGEFSNKDLLDYFTATQTAIEKANKNVDNISEMPAIQLQQNNQVNINISDTIDRDSRERVTSTVQEILKALNKEESNGDSYVDN